MTPGHGKPNMGASIAIWALEISRGTEYYFRSVFGIDMRRLHNLKGVTAKKVYHMALSNAQTAQ